jgi:hypothetical protein
MMPQRRPVLLILVSLFLIFSYGVASGETIRAFVPDQPWEIAIEVKDFTPWDVLMSKTLLGGNAGKGIIITILTENEKRPFTPDEVLKEYWHYGPPGGYITEYKSNDMIIVSTKEASPPLGKTFNGYAVKDNNVFDIHISADPSKITNQEVVNIIRSFRISPSPEKQAMENLINNLNSEKDNKNREQILLAFAGKYPENSWVFMLMGEMYFATGRLDLAEKAYLRALENHRTQPMVNAMNLWLCYDGLGLIYGMTRRYEPAKGFFEKGYKCAESMLNNEKIALSAYNLACLYAETNDPLAALKYLEKAISLNPEQKIKARTDSSFASMKNRDDFKKLVSE